MDIWCNMKQSTSLVSWFAPLLRDERGGEVLEYALIAGLIVVAAIAAITAVGGQVMARWTSVQTNI